MAKSITRKSLIAKIDKARREYVKKRDQDWKDWGVCISCGVSREAVELQAGHYYSRIHDFTTELGLCEENVNLQCVPCNYSKRGNPQGYAMGIIRKYGETLLKKLEEAKKTPKRYKIKDLEELLIKYKEQ